MRIQGVSQIVFFNWPFFAAAFAAAVLSLAIKPILPVVFHPWIELGVLVGGLSVLLSLLVSWYVYDLGNIYAFDYISDKRPKRIANIHAGFDETSLSLRKKFLDSVIDIYDFYDPKKHTEASIRRARARYPAPVETTSINSSHIPVGDNTYDLICLIFAAHEIRDEAERINFFKEMQTVATPEASLYVIEHLRDWRNALVYSIGCLHFHSESSWHDTFSKSGWQVINRTRLNAFVICYQLKCIPTST